MRLPEEDLPPRWLRDYGDIEADISRMEEFSANLLAEVTDNYAPHMAHVGEAMAVELPRPSEVFRELVDFLTTHRESQQGTSDLVYYYRDVTGGLATAAATVSGRYGEADAFSAAKVKDVQSAFDQTAVASAPMPDPAQPPAEPVASVTANPEAQ